VSLSVQFASGSAELTPAARQTLDQLGKALSSSDLAQYRFRIEGHTDTVGAADYNQALSQQRADAVAAYLADKFGVNMNRLQAVGMGEQGLLVATPPNTPNEKNRRVNVVNLGA
jgi:outer membrane protein OmpA-like peptidoglycan-associated protein